MGLWAIYHSPKGSASGYQAIFGIGIMCFYMTGLTCIVGYVNRVGFYSRGFWRKTGTK